MFLARFAFVATITVTTSGCFGLVPGMTREPLPANDVETLTVCKNADMAKIKKNLVLNGFTIRSQTDDVIETDFKQVDGRGTSKFSERISVVKVDEGKAKFKVRVKEQGMEKVETGQMKSSTGQVLATDSKLVSTENEADQKYYADGKPEYEATRKSVCGD